MWRYAVRRLLQAVPVFFGTTLLIYAMVFALPGDPIQALARDKPVPDSVLRTLRDRYNLDDPLLVQYAKYMWGLLQGDLGENYTGQSVSEMLGGRWAVTARLALTAWLFELAAGIARSGERRVGTEGGAVGPASRRGK